MVESHLSGAQHDTLFEHAYPSAAPDLRRLYEKAKRDQWNVSKDVDWDQPFDLEQGVLADEMIDIYGTPFWDRLSAAQRSELNHKFARWRLGVLLYGEHGAMLVCSQLVEAVSGTDAKFFQATQLQDEARHMGFGMLSLPDVVGQMTDAERKDMEEVTHWALIKTLTGQFPAQVYQEIGFSEREIKEIHGHRRERAAGAEGSHFRKLFRKDLHGTLLANLQKIGLLTERMRPRLESVGIRVPSLA